MEKYTLLFLGTGIVYAIAAIGRRVANIMVKDDPDPAKIKRTKTIGWILEKLSAAAVVLGVVYIGVDHMATQSYIDTLKSCVFTGTTDTVGNVFGDFYGKLEWEVKDPASKEKNHKYIIMTGQCYREAAMVNGKELVDVEIVFDARKTMDDYYQFSRLYGLVNGTMLSDEEFSALIEDTYGSNLDITNMFDDGISAGLSAFADFYISDMNKRLFSGKYISYYDDKDEGSGEMAAAETTEGSRSKFGDQAAQAQRAMQTQEEESYYEPEDVYEEWDQSWEDYAYLEDSASYEDFGNSQEYLLPDSDTRLLTDADVSGLSPEELRIAKNEIYARHGRMFTSEDLKEYFESKSWYQGSVPAEAFSESVFSQTEKDNITFIQKYIDDPSRVAADTGYRERGLAINDSHAIPQIPGIYHYYSDTSDKNRMSMELDVEGGRAYVSFNEDGHQHMRSQELYNINDQEYGDESGDVGIYFDDYGRIATYHDSVSGGLNGAYTFLP